MEEFICEMERLDIQSWSKELMQIVRETKEVLSYSIHGLEKAYNELNAAWRSCGKRLITKDG